MEKFKLYILNNKRIFITFGSLFAIILSCLGCFFYYQHNQNKNVINEVIFSDLENNIDNETFSNDESKFEN